MARKNNKGFSVVEIIIAITILSLLLVPIITQISQTFKTSRKAKEQQYVTDNAVYLMEEFKKSSVDELELKYGTADDAGNITNIKKGTQEAQVCSADGTPIANAKVEYSYIIYNIAPMEFGADKNMYSRTIILDDLSSSLMSFDAYSAGVTGAAEGKSYRPLVSGVAVGDFVLDGEGNNVKYNDQHLVTDIICEDAELVANPNKVNLGNMKNLDSTKVAIIPGSATGFDAQAEEAFFSLAMDKLKVDNYDSWEQALLQVKSDSVLNQYDNLANTKKTTKIYVDKVDGSESAKGYYVVSVDVIYENSDINETLDYNVYSQKFEFDTINGVPSRECPEVYIEYQPYTAETKTDSVRYAANDYIIIDNYVEGAKIYLYKPFEDQMNKFYNVGESSHKNGGTMYTYYQTNALNSDPVTVNVCYADTYGKPAYIYTNIELSTFDCDLIDPGIIKTVKGKSNSLIRKAFESDHLKSLLDDTRYQNRLYTINVFMTPVVVEDGVYKPVSSANVINLTGAKGDN